MRTAPAGVIRRARSGTYEAASGIEPEYRALQARSSFPKTAAQLPCLPSHLATGAHPGHKIVATKGQ